MSETFFHASSPTDAWERICREPQLFQELLSYSTMNDIDALLLRAVTYARERVGAAEGFFAIYEDSGAAESTPRWCAVAGRSVERARWPDEIREVFSTGVTRQALELWRKIDVVSPYGASSPSFQIKKIHNVLAVPVGGQARGVLVLQNVDAERLHDEAFHQEYVSFAVTFGSLLSPFVDRAVLIAREGDAVALGVAGSSKATMDLRARLRQVASRDDWHALVIGVPGSGRTHIARVLHATSPRRSGPLVQEHCGAWGPNDACDVLFGVDGPQGQTALLASVDGGTLLLEDIDALPSVAQAALARFLVTGLYRPRGANSDRRASVRIVATAPVPRDAALPQPNVRSDLLNRLTNGLIRLPKLADHREDVPELLERLGRAAAARQNVEWPGVERFTAMDASRRKWQGDIGELAVAVEQALQHTQGRRPIDSEALFGPAPEPPRVPIIDDWLHHGVPILSWHDAKDALHRAYLLRMLIVHDLARAGTARALKINTSVLFSLIERLNLWPTLHELDAERKLLVQAGRKSDLTELDN